MKIKARNDGSATLFFSKYVIIGSNTNSDGNGKKLFEESYHPISFSCSKS